MSKKAKSKPTINLGVLKRVIKILFKYYKLYLIICLICGVISTAAGLTSSVFLQKFIDNCITPGIKNGIDSVKGTIITLGVTMLSIYVLATISNYILNRLFVNITQGTLRNIRNQMFEHMESLESLNLRSFNTSIVTDMSGMFCHCEKLTSLDVSHFDTSSVKKTGAMFDSCQSLTSIDLSSWDTISLESVIEVGSDYQIGMFESCYKLETITVKAGTDWSAFTDEANKMFRYSSSLKGENGTTYSEEHSGAEYARVDGGTSAPGYFTANKTKP